MSKKSLQVSEDVHELVVKQAAECGGKIYTYTEGVFQSIEEGRLVRLDENVYEKLGRVAEETDCSVNKVVSNLLFDALCYRGVQ